MEEIMGKICPFCKTEIKPGEAVKVCPACGIPHHEICWEENHGCTTFGCSEQHYEEQHTNPTDVCVNCGAPLGDGQMFCPKCGTPKAVPAPQPQTRFCPNCGAELADGQMFCTKCGAPANAEPAMNPAAPGGYPGAQQYGTPNYGAPNYGAPNYGAPNYGAPGVQQYGAPNNGMPGFGAPAQKKKTVMIAGIAAAVLLVIIAAVALPKMGKKSFKKMYPDLAKETWCTIGSDGTWMRLDTNPTNMDNDDMTWTYYSTVFTPCNDMIEKVNLELGFSTAVYERMNSTTWSMGVQTASNDKYTISWTYHPDKGLEVMYEIK